MNAPMAARMKQLAVGPKVPDAVDAALSQSNITDESFYIGNRHRATASPQCPNEYNAQCSFKFQSDTPNQVGA